MSFTHSRRNRNRRRMILARRQEMAAAVTGHASLEFLQDAFSLEKPLTWVITGDRYPSEPKEPTLSEALARHLRIVHDRPDETVFDTSQRGDRVLALELSLDHRVLRYDPSVVVVAIGNDDPRIEQRLAECQAFAKMLDQLNQHDVVTVVIPPPRFIGGGHDPRLNRWRDDIVELTTTRNAVLVPTTTSASLSAVADRLIDTLRIRYPIVESPTLPDAKPVNAILPLIQR